MKPLKLTYGSDPELVIVNGDGLPVSALRILRRTKEKPINLGDGICCYADNVLMEGRFTPVPYEGIVQRIGTVLRRMKSALGPYDMLPQAAITFPKSELKSKKAWEIGCSDNLGAYRPLAEMVNPKLKFTDGLRTGSFHIHIGREDWESWPDDRLLDFKSKIEAIRLLDIYVGISSIIWDYDQTASVRRKLYGQAGEFRKTAYGVEYRVLGNYALCCPRLVALVFKLVDIAMEHISNGTAQDVLKQFNPKDIVYAINENNSTAAEQVVHTLDLGEELTHMIMSYSPKSTNIARNWGF